jgi:hypothetical protein
MSRIAMFPLGAAAVLAALVAAGCGSEKPKTETYASQERGFSVTFPCDWQKSTTGYGMDLEVVPPNQVDSGGFRDALFVRVEGIGKTMLLDEFFAAKVAKMAAVVPEFKEIEKGPTNLNGQDARRLVWSYAHGNTPVQSMAYFLLSGQRGYTIAGSARVDRFAQRTPAFEEVMATFKVEGAPAAAAPAAPAATTPPAAPAASAPDKPAAPPAPADSPAPSPEAGK